jgi:predicted regulator of Ras-like GTPase activity (Roadblock/LC7/MglB family)
LLLFLVRKLRRVMFSIFRKFFKPTAGKPAPAPPAAPTPAATPPAAPARRAPSAEPSTTGAAAPSVEVAHLSLAAIVSRFPEDLKPLVLAPPSNAATISFPVQLIQKQLATGSVKMSLASLHRQAPPGVFGPLAPGERRQVEIPLKEVFRHVNPQTLKRRADQRATEAPDEFNLFGNSDNPHQIAPTAPRDDSSALGVQPASRIAASALAPQPPGPERMVEPPAPTPMRVVAPPPSFAPPAAPPPSVAVAQTAAAVPRLERPPLTLPVSTFAAAWPEAIRAEVGALDPATTVTLNGGAVSSGLTKGKVVFTWGEIRAGFQPAPAQPTAVDESVELVLPLKIVAPAFLAAGKNGKTARKTVQIDEAIPSLFSNGREPASAPAAPVLAAPAPAAPDPVPPAPAQVASEPPLVLAAPAPVASPSAIGEILGEPDRVDFTPSAIVAGTVKLPGVSGAIVAMNEGLPVATALPDGVKSEVVAAFLPQIFARLNQYAGEMKLGDVDDLLFTTHGAQCQIYRLGAVYFAALGHPGAVLPTRELRLIAAELGRQIR